MEETKTNIKIAPPTKGMIEEEVMSYEVVPEDSFSWMENAQNDTSGYVTTRREFKKRTPASGASISSPLKVHITGNLSASGRVQIYYQQTNHLYMQDLINNANHYDFGAIFSSSNAINRYDVYNGRLAFTDVGTNNGVRYVIGDSTAAAALDTEFSSSVDCIQLGFAGRVWGIATGGSPKLEYSDVLPVNWPSSALSTAANNYVAINTKDPNLTALGVLGNTMYVFSTNNIFKVTDSNSVSNNPNYQVGTVSPESLVKTHAGYFFYHPSGIYLLDQGGGLNQVSQQIYYLLKRIKPNNQKSVFGWSRDQFVYFYLGNLMGLDSNKYWIVRFNLVTQTWSVYSTRTAILCAHGIDVGNMGSGDLVATTEEWFPPVVLFTASDLVTFDIFDPSSDTVYGDFNSSGAANTAQRNIFVDVRTQWLTFGDETSWKTISGIAIPHINAEGFKVQIQYDKDDEEAWEDVCVIGSDAVSLCRDFLSSEFNRCKLRFTGTTSGNPVKFGMPTLLLVTNQGYKHG